MKELTAKLRALDFAVKRSDELVKTNSSEAISRHEQSIVTKINACHTLKDSIEEEKIVKEKSEEQVTEWVSGIEQKLKAADKKVLELRGTTDGIGRQRRAHASGRKSRTKITSRARAIRATAEISKGIGSKSSKSSKSCFNQVT